MNNSRPNTADRILAATKRLYCASGTGAPTMDDVAKATGIGRATLYRHFGNRDELLLAAMEREALYVAARVEKKIRRYQKPAEHIIEGMVEAREEIRRNDLFNAIFQSGESATVNRLVFNTNRLVNIGREIMLPLVQRARDSGELDTDMDFDTMVEWILRLLLSLVTVPSKKLESRAGVRKMLRATMLPVLEGGRAAT